MTSHANRFPTTSETLLGKLQSGDAGIRYEGVTRFGKVYGPVLLGWARSQGMSVQDAEDSVQDLLVRVIEDDLLDGFDRTNGSRLSSWLITVFANQARKAHSARGALKRGGGAIHVEFDSLNGDQECGQMLHLAAMDPEVRFDLAVARRLWSLAVVKWRLRYAEKPQAKLVADLEPFVLLLRWPSAPELSQREVAQKHGLSTAQLKAFFNHTLKSQAKFDFFEEAGAASPGITEADIEHLWELLRAHA